jgi:hypothetical protein
MNQLHPSSMEQLRQLLKLHGRREIELALKHIEAAELAEPGRLVGKRVTIAPHYDLWMRGARCGEVRSVYLNKGVPTARVQMDAFKHRTKLYHFPVADLTPIT